MRDPNLERILQGLPASVPPVIPTGQGRLTHTVQQSQDGPLLFPNVAVAMMHDQAIAHIASVVTTVLIKLLHDAGVISEGGWAKIQADANAAAEPDPGEN